MGKNETAIGAESKKRNALKNYQQKCFISQFNDFQ